MSKKKVTIDDVRITKNVYIYEKLKPLNKDEIFSLFKTLKAKKNKNGRWIIKEVKEYSEDIQCIIMSFPFKDEPSFLKGTNEIEIKYALCFLIELNNYIFIYKKNVGSIENLLKKEGYIKELGYKKFSHFKAVSNPKYEKLSVSNMTISNAVIRARSFESYNLDGILSLTSSSRSIVKNFRLNDNGCTYSISPNTSKINRQSSKINVDEYIKWCSELISELENKEDSSFINNFARPISLQEINAELMGIIFNVEFMLNLNKDDFFRKEGEIFQKLGIDKYETLSQNLKRVYSLKQIQGIAKQYKVKDNESEFGTITRNKNSISIQKSIIDDIYFEAEGEKKSMKDYIHQNMLYTVVFDKPEYALIGRSAFEDKKLITKTTIKKIISICEDDSENFKDIESEKEKFNDKNDDKSYANKLDEFPEKSLFSKIEKEYSNGILICDDMGDEWADFIHIADSEIKFIHAKYTNETYGASAMHEVVSQALKNIGRVHASIEDYKFKYEKKEEAWSNYYEKTEISRLRYNGEKEKNMKFSKIEEALEKIYSNPNSLRKVYLITPFFCKTKLESELNKFILNTQTKVYYFQLIWLLNSFISACQDYGVQPYIICKNKKECQK